MSLRYNYINKLIQKLFLSAIFYHQFIILGMFVDKIFELVNNNEVSAETLFFTVAISVIANLFLITLLVFYPFIFAFLSLFFSLIKRMNILAKLNLHYIFNLFLSKHIVIKLIMFYLITLIPYITIITLGLYLPISIYELLTKTSAFFAPRDAMLYFFNYKVVFEYGVPGYILFCILVAIVRSILGKELNVAKYYNEIKDIVIKIIK